MLSSKLYFVQAALDWLTQLSATPHLAAWVRTPQLLPLPAPQAQASNPPLVASAPLALVSEPALALGQALDTTTTTPAPLALA